MNRATPAVLLAALAAGCAEPGPWDPPPGDPLAVRFERRGAWAPAEGSVEGRVEVAMLEPLEADLDVWLAEGWELAAPGAAEDSAEDPGAASSEPALPEGFGGTIETMPGGVAEAGRWKRWRVTLLPTRPGEQVVPPFGFSARGPDGATASAASRPVELAVTSRLAADDGGDMEGLGLEDAPVDPWPAIGVGAALLAALGGLVWFWRWRRSKRPAPPSAVDVPAHVRAERALVALRERPRRTEAEVDAFYVEVSAVLRTYIEERFGVAAPDRTTDEFLAECDGHPALGAARPELARFLRRCDMVKFAGERPAEAAHLEVLDEAVRFVESTRPDRLRPEATAASEEVRGA